MTNTAILAPAAVLVVWSMIMLWWLAAARAPAIRKMRTGEPIERGVRGPDVEHAFPPKVRWKGHNFAHLMEQPTIFYPAVVILALAGATATDVWLAWAYVILRIVHSLWQALVNIVLVRMVIFLLSSIVMTALAIRALLSVI